MVESSAEEVLNAMTGRANRLTVRARRRRAAPLMPAATARAFVDAFERLGYDVPSLLDAVDADRDDLLDPDGLIPSAVSGGFLARALLQRRLANIGVRLAEITPIGAFPLLDYLIVTSERVSDGCRQLARYIHLAGGAPVEVCEDESPVRLAVHARHRVSAEYLVTLAVLRLREEAGRRLRVTYVSFSHDPDDVGDIERVLACPVRSGAPWTGLALDRDAWGLPLRRGDPILHGLLETQAEALVARQRNAEGVPLDVRRVLRSRFARSRTDIHSVARALATSVRSLQRRLADAGCTYQDLRDEMRKDAASRYVTDSSLSIAEIGYRLGYSDPAAFTRAFKRWHDRPPRCFRDRPQRPGTGLPSPGQPG
jgi:AraC-like DNA-binding protein